MNKHGKRVMDAKAQQLALRKKREAYILDRDTLEPERYRYLDKRDSLLYDKVKDGKDWREIEIKRLLEDKVASSRSQHRSSIK